MDHSFSIPLEHQESFRRLLPYMVPAMRNDQQAIEALLLYLKLGGEKLARIVIDAFNQTQHMNHAELQKRLREEAMLAEQLRDSEKADDEEASDEDEDEDEDGEAEASDEEISDY